MKKKNKNKKRKRANHIRKAKKTNYIKKLKALKLRKINIKLVLGLIFSVMLLSKCSLNEMNGHQSSNLNNQAYSAMDLIDYAEQAKEQEIEALKITHEEEFEKHYANGLYLEDLDEIRAEFKSKYTKKLETELKAVTGYPLFIDTKVEFYNLSLKQVKEGSLTFDEAVANPREHIRKANLSIYLFYKEEDHHVHTDAIDEQLRKWQDSYREAGLVECELIWRGYEPDVLQTYSIETLKEQPYPLTTLTENGICFTREMYLQTGENTYKDEDKYDSPKYDSWRYEDLFEKYNTEDFIVSKFDWEGESDYIVYPKDDPTLWFHTNGPNDKYLTVRAQKILIDRIYQIIEEEGASEYMAAACFPREDSTYYTISTDYDFSGEWDEDDLINNGYKYKYDINLIYMLDNEQSVELSKVKKIAGRVYDLLEDRPDISDENVKRHPAVTFCFFYELNEIDRKTTLKLFRENTITERVILNSHSFGDIYKNMYKTHDESDGYIFLDLYGDKKDFLLKMFSDPKNVGLEKFIERSKQSSSEY